MTTTERRKFPRHRVLKSGTISFHHSGTVTCRVRNLSEGGACLEVESPVGIPQNFILLIESENLNRKTRVIWKREQQIGVAFH
jgi:hypothetical protein